MNCEKCQDRGFTEENHGLTVILCDCDKARDVAERNGIPLNETRVEVLGGKTEEIPSTIEERPDDAESGECIGGFLDDSDSGTRQTDSDTGSGDTSEPKQSSKPKKKRKSRKGIK